MAVEARIPDDVLHGEILSNAHLTLRPKRRNSQFRLVLAGAEHVDRLLVVKSSLAELGVYTSPKYPKVTPRDRYTEISLISRQHPLITAARQQWYKMYPDGGYRKSVPHDLELSPLIVAHWFMGDGCSKRDKRPGYQSSITCYFLTESYDIDSIILLERRLHELGIETGRIYKKPKPTFGASVRITVLQKSIDGFMNMITPHMLPSYNYKILKKKED